MSNYRKSRLFGKKEKTNLFIFVCVSLFIILAIYLIGTRLTVGTSSNDLSINQVSNNNTDFNKELDVNDNNSENVIDNAIQVKDDSKLDTNLENSLNNIGDLEQKDTVSSELNEEVNNEVLNNKSDVAKEGNSDSSEVPVSSSNGIEFAKPIDGEIIREYANDTIFSKTLNSWRTREGVDFKAPIGTSVVSVLDGVVEKIDNDLTERGNYIVIKHDDGFKTIYSNLDEEVKVVSGQKVKKSEVIAMVGNSSGNYSNEDYGAHLNFSMYLNNEEVDPAEYIKFK